MLRRRDVLEEPVVSPLDEICYFMTTLDVYGDPFSRVPSAANGFESDDGDSLFIGPFDGIEKAAWRLLGFVSSMRTHSCTSQDWETSRRDDLVLWPPIDVIDDN